MYGLNRVKALVLIIILGLSLFASEVKAEPIEYMSFEGFTLTSDTTSASVTHYVADSGTWKVLKTITVSFPSKKYFSGFYLKWYVWLNDDLDGEIEGVTYNIRIRVNGVVVWTWTGDTVLEGRTEYNSVSEKLFNLYNSTFTITVEAYRYGTYASEKLVTTFESMYMYFINENLGVKSKLTELKYFPPGAEGTSQALVLNLTEVYLNKSMILPEGTVSFWLKWDGSTGITISDNIGIDANGYIYIKNDDGTVYTLEGVTPPIGKYVPIYIAWKNGEGYIMINTTKITLNWNGNVTISKVGSITDSTSTLVDEFKVWNYFIPSDQILLESTAVSYEVNVDGKILKIQPEGGFSLPILNVVFLDASLNPLNSTTLSRSSQSAVAPANTTFIGLEAGNIKRLYYLENLSEVKLAFPSDDVSSVSVVTIIVPSGYNLLEVWTLDGKLAFRYPVQKTTTFTAVSGAYYKFVAYGNNTEITVVRQVSSDLVSLEIPEISTAVYLNTTQERLEVTKDVVNGVAVATYVAPEPKNITATFTIYAPNGTVILNTTTAYYNVQYKQWVFSLPAEFAYATLTVKSDTYEATKTIAGTLNRDSWFSEDTLPSGLALILIGTFGIWMFNKKNSGYAPSGTLLLLTISDYVGLVHMDMDLYAVLVVMSIVGLYTSREG